MPGPVIAEHELRFTYSRSSGPGGQNVNRVETRVTLLFDLDASPSLSAEQKRRVRTRLATRINKDGVLRIVSQRYRTREGNRRAALERFEELLTEACRPERPRRKTRATKAAKRRRLESKRKRGAIKRLRGKRGAGED
jgi:ribosome-associated protein